MPLAGVPQVWIALDSHILEIDATVGPGNPDKCFTSLFSREPTPETRDAGIPEANLPR